MSANLVYVHPVPDYTGLDPKYLVVNEERDLVKEAGYYMFLPFSGPFFADSVEIYDSVTETRLDEGVDYHFDVFESAASAKANADIFAAIKWDKEKYPTLETIPKFRLKYQFVGGPFHANISGLLQAVRDMETVAEIIYWDNIYGKPTVYPPAFHLHKASDITHLNSTNDILRAINVSINDLADRLVAAKEPKYNVTYGGRVKYAFDAGRELQGGMGNNILLEFPRSETQNAQFAMTIEILTDVKAYTVLVMGREDGSTGFLDGTVSITTDLIEDYTISAVTLETLLGKNYLNIALTTPIPTGNYVVQRATVNYHTPEEWVEPWIWYPAAPDSNDPEFKSVKAALIEKGTMGALEQQRNLKRNLNVVYTDEVMEGETFVLKFPKGVSRGHQLFLEFEGLANNMPQYFAVKCVVSDVNVNLNSIKIFSEGDVDRDTLYISDIAWDFDFGYVVFRHDTAGTIGGLDLALARVSATNNGAELQFGYEFLKNPDLSGKEIVSTTTNPIINLQNRHKHPIADIAELANSLAAINTTLTTHADELTKRVTTWTMSNGSYLEPNVNLNDQTWLSFRRHPIITAGNEADWTPAIYAARNYPPGLTKEDLSDSRFEVKVLVVDMAKQYFHLKDGRTFYRLLNIPSRVAVTEWIEMVVPTNGNLQKSYQLDLTGLDNALYYLVELSQQSGINSPLPIQLAAAVEPQSDTATANLYGSVHGEFRFPNGFTRNAYYDYTALLGTAETAKFAFDSVWYNQPANDTIPQRLFMYVKGGEVVNLMANVLSVTLHTTDTVVIDNDGADVVVATAVNTVPSESTSWKKLTDLVPDTKANSLV